MRILIWIFGIAFIFEGIFDAFAGRLPIGVSFLLFGLLLLPPSYKILSDKSGVKLEGKKKAIVIILILFVGGAIQSNIDKQRKETDAAKQTLIAAQAEAKERQSLIQDFQKNKSSILLSARSLLKEGKNQDVIDLSQKYSAANDHELLNFAREAEAAVILSSIKSADKTDVDLLSSSYKRLSTLYPSNDKYKKLAASYRKLLDEKNESERVAAEQQRQPEEMTSINIMGTLIKVGDTSDQVFTVLKPEDLVDQTVMKDPSNPASLLVVKNFRVNGKDFTIYFARVQDPGPYQVTRIIEH